MSADFLTAFSRLPSRQQRGVRSMIARFERDPTASGLNYEKIANARDPNMRSLRIDGGYRAIVLKPEKGDVHLLLWAAKHDEAYRWAERHRCSINAETGALQVYRPRGSPPDASREPGMSSMPNSSGASAMASAPIVSGTRDSDEPPLFGRLKHRQLVRLGVPAEMTEEVLQVRSEATLDELATRLPVEAYDGLFLYMAGDAYETIILERETPPKSIDPTDYPAALAHNDSRSRFVRIENDLELEKMFNAPLERWRVFLHPSQRRLVERHWNGPVRVLGGAGTGKTVVAMHRARWLAREVSGDKRILFTTFTRNLASDIESNMRSICTPEEMNRIEVTNLDRWVQRFLRGKRYRFRLSFGREPRAWKRALDRRASDLPYAESFYNDEWEHVVQANSVATQEEYLRIPRTGRGVRLNRGTRARIWPVFEEYRALLAERGVMEVADCYRAAAALLQEDETGANYASVVVDEAQDLSAVAWRLIRAIAPPGKNDLFIVGDAHQRIYSRFRVILGRSGVDIRGRGRKLRLNYRTTEETRRWASRILGSCSIDDLDGGVDANTGLYSVAHGPEPQIKRFADREDQAVWLVDYLTQLMDQNNSMRGVCVVARTTAERDAIGEALVNSGLQVVALEAETPDGSSRGVRLATMHRVKGLEFDRVVIASTNSDTVPLAAAMNATDAESHERISAETAERALLYVAATRARKELIVSSFGEPSPFLA